MVVTGPAVSGPALLLGLADIVIMTSDAYAFVSGPHMVRQFTGVPISNVHLGGAAVRSCQVPVRAAVGKPITTIEGLSSDGSHPVQRAWVDEDVAQCGYCQAGQIMAAAALLAATPQPTDAEIDDAMSGNLCRCGTYQRIRAAIHRAADGAA